MTLGFKSLVRNCVFGRHLEAAVGLEPRLEGMNLVSYLLLHHCDIFKARYVAFSIPKTDASKRVAVCAFFYKYYIKIFKESQI